jgi:hypothetical protein
MGKFVLSYRVPRDYTPGRPETVAAWTAWFKGMGRRPGAPRPRCCRLQFPRGHRGRHQARRVLSRHH